MTSEAPDALAGQSRPADPAQARIARISLDAATSPAVRILRRALTLSWLARALGIAALVYGFVYAQFKVGDVGAWQPLVRGAIVLIALIVVSIWALGESWAAHERRVSRRRRAHAQR